MSIASRGKNSSIVSFRVRSATLKMFALVDNEVMVQLPVIVGFEVAVSPLTISIGPLSKLK